MELAAAGGLAWAVLPFRDGREAASDAAAPPFGGAPVSLALEWPSAPLSSCPAPGCLGGLPAGAAFSSSEAPESFRPRPVS